MIALLIPQSFYVVRDAQPQGRMTAAEASRLRRKRPLQRAILKWCEQSRVDCLDLTTGLASHPEHEALYFRGDAHWTPLGHRVAAGPAPAAPRRAGRSHESGHRGVVGRHRRIEGIALTYPAVLDDQMSWRERCGRTLRHLHCGAEP